LVFASESDDFFQVLAKSAAQKHCPADSSRLVLRRAEATIETSGVGPKMDRFYKKYYE
jgi:hypothetical protein